MTATNEYGYTRPEIAPMTADVEADMPYEPGSPKRSDYREPLTCVLCYGRGGHYEGCVELA